MTKTKLVLDSNDVVALAAVLSQECGVSHGPKTHNLIRKLHDYLVYYHNDSYWLSLFITNAQTKELV